MNNLNREQIEDFRRTFDLVDKDQSGSITTDELKIVMVSLGQNPLDSELQDMVNEVDTDGNGTIDFDEFLSLMDRKMRGEVRESDMEEEYVEAFKIFDLNGDGLISKTDLMTVFKILDEEANEEEIEEVILQTSTDGDNVINYDKFVITFDRVRKEAQEQYF